jgi:hypothetical protein
LYTPQLPNLIGTGKASFPLIYFIQLIGKPLKPLQNRSPSPNGSSLLNIQQECVVWENLCTTGPNVPMLMAQDVVSWKMLYTSGCKGLDSRSVWETSLEKLCMWMISASTDLNIHYLVLHYLRSWWEDVGPSAYVLPALLATILKQQSIGWNRCLKGWLSNKWTVCQQHYYEKM